MQSVVFLIAVAVAVAAAGPVGYDYQASGVADFGFESQSNARYSVLDGPVVQSELNKEYYLYSAPEGDFYDGDASQRALSSVKKNLRVVFVKTPENNGLTNAALQLAKRVNEDKTAIYVLSKQPDVSELANQVQQLRQSVSHKPEVRFIKYRTAEDAANAQRSIQQQYNALSGPSYSSNEGFAPVLNFASASQHSGHVISSGGDLHGGVSASNLSPIELVEGGPRSEYLPPSLY